MNRKFKEFEWVFFQLVIISIIYGVYVISKSMNPSSSYIEDSNWIPKGLIQYYNDSEIGWRWSKDGTYTCERSGCVQIEIVSKNGCGNVYVEATRLDDLGNNIGYTNATTSNLVPKQKALLQLPTFGSKIQLSEIKCN